MEIFQLAKLTPHDLILDGLDSTTAHLLCGALDDLKYSNKLFFIYFTELICF